MHPFLKGFWTTVGPGGLALFALLFLRDSKRIDWSLSPLAAYIPIFLYALPVLAMGYVYLCTLAPGRHEASLRKRKRQFTGGLWGLGLTLIIIFLSIGFVMSPPPALPTPTIDKYVAPEVQP